MPTSNIKHLIYTTLTIGGFVLLVSGIWLYHRHQVWLQGRNLDSLLLWGLIIFGIFVVLMPFHLSYHWATLTPQGMVREFVVKAGQIIGLLATIIAVFYLATQLITLPRRLGYPNLMWFWLFLLLIPLLLVLIDLFNGTYARTLSNLGVGFLLYMFKLNGMILIQIVGAAGAVFLFPAGFFMQFLSLVDIIMTLFGRGAGDALLLCSWANVGAALCTPFLFTFHIGHLLLVAVVALYGETVFNKTADLYATGLDWLAARLAA
ncbi:MAG: hypothetical protein R6X32_22820 [Chloroflexota bacterium]|jgi:hypothetical protein